MPCLIVGTQTDLRDDPQVRDKLAKQKMQPVRKEDGERMAKDLGAVKYVECSALTQYKLKDVFDEAIVAALEPPVAKTGKKRTSPCLEWSKMCVLIHFHRKRQRMCCAIAVNAQHGSSSAARRKAFRKALIRGEALAFEPDYNSPSLLCNNSERNCI